MLSLYEGKNVKIETNDGEVFVGEAQAYPSGYGLHEFGVAEEGVEVDGTFIFLSQIKSVEVLCEARKAEENTARYEAVSASLIDGPFRIADILPRRVESESPGQYFAVERYFRQPERLSSLYRRYAEMILRLNCYYDMAVSFDSEETWEFNPDPGSFAERVKNLSGNSFLRAVFPDRNSMIDLEPGDTYATVYCSDPDMLGTLGALCGKSGFFLWEEETD